MNCEVSDITASRIVDLAKLFYSDPENVRKFNEWKKEKELAGKKANE